MQVQTEITVITARYRTMRTDYLLQLRAAFALDDCDAVSETAKAFCRGRIAIIERVLTERGVTHD